MNLSVIPVLAEKLKNIKKRLKKHIHGIPHNKVNKEVVSLLLKDANKLKKIINDAKALQKKPNYTVTCPHCHHKILVS